jgi:hypothetical protein
MNGHCQQQPPFPDGQATGAWADRDCATAPSAGTGGGRERPGPGGLWLLLAPLACCGGPLLIAALAAAGALAWGGIALAAAALLAGAGLVLWRRRKRACCPPPGTADPQTRAEKTAPRSGIR